MVEPLSEWEGREVIFFAENFTQISFGNLVKFQVAGSYQNLPKSEPQLLLQTFLNYGWF